MWVMALVASAAQVHLRVEPVQLAVGQTGRASVFVVSEGRRDSRPSTDAPALPITAGLESTFEGQQQEFRNENGRIRQIHEFRYRLTALEEGSWNVGPVEIAFVDGKRRATDMVRVKVVARSDRDQPEIEVVAGFAKQEIWEGEVVLYEFGFRSTVPGIDVEWKHPRFDGLREPQEGQADVSRYDVEDPEGRITVSKGIIPLIATGTGVRDQKPGLAVVKTPVGPSTFGAFRRVRTQTWPTRPAKLTVRPLPEAPPNFSGLVGDFEVVSTLEPLEAVVGQSLSWGLHIQGRGALEGFTAPNYDAPGVSIYEKGSRLNAGIINGDYKSAATFERVLVPTDEGTLALPAFELVTFSPKRGDYVTHLVDFAEVTVRPGREGASEITSFAEGLDPDLLITDGDEVTVVPRPIITQGAAASMRIGRWIPLLLFLTAAPGLGLLGLDGWRLARDRWARRRRPTKAPPTPAEMVRALPAAPMERNAVLEAALRTALEASAEDDGLEKLLERLLRLRYAGGADDADLQADIVAALNARRQP